MGWIGGSEEAKIQGRDRELEGRARAKREVEGGRVEERRGCAVGS